MWILTTLTIIILETNFFMLSNKTLRNIAEYSRAYKSDLPFNHIVMDDFFRDDVIEKLLDEVEFIASNPSEVWRF